MADKKNGPKKSCPRHSRYYYRCNDCRALNGESPIDRDKVLYPDAFSEDEVEIEQNVSRTKPPVSRPPVRPSGPRKPRRYSGKAYMPSPRTKRFLILGIIIAAIIAIISIVYGYPAWHGRIALQEQLYDTKAGFDYWGYYTLNFWSSQFFFNWTALIGAIIGVVIFLLPPEQGLIKSIAYRLNRQPPSTKKIAVFWATAGFGIFYLVGQLIDLMGSFAWGIYLAQNGEIISDFSVVTNSLAVLTDPTALSQGDIFAYQLLYLPIINYVFVLIILRFIINAANQIVNEENFVVGLANVFIVVGLILVAVYLNRPVFSVNGLDVIQIYAVILGFVGFLAGGVVLYIYGKAQGVKSFQGTVTKSTFAIVVVIIVLIAVPLFASVPVAIGLSSDDYQTWYREQWMKQTQTEINWTRDAAGINDLFFERRSIQELFDLNQNATEEIESLRNFRVYDKQIAIRTMHPRTNRYEALGDADIVYIEDKEYWVAPKTIEMDAIGTQPANLHTALYDHVEGFYAINTFTGVLMDDTTQYQETFGVRQNYPIFFGEYESAEYQRTLELFDSDEDVAYSSAAAGAYEPDILLYTEWGTSIENYQYNYTGTPDGSLSGLEKFWYTVGLGMFAYAIQNDTNSYLINRNIMKRVGSIMYPYLRVDSDSYLVFDKDNGKMYYAASIFTEIPLNSFAQAPIMRFLGVCLVDVRTGTLSFYRNPSLPTSSTQDRMYPFYSIYMDADLYGWQDTPAWLLSQLRYPESLYEMQLAYDYLYHVQDPATWKQGSDIFERPDNGDLFYIETNIGEGQEFVGIDVVEYKGLESRVLAGMYVVRHGANFGKTIFYSAKEVSLIGPQTAWESFKNTAYAGGEIILQNPANYRRGNTLLYPLHNTLFYFIPVYASQSGTSTTTLESLSIAGMVNATNQELVGYGDAPLDAYDNLNLTRESEIPAVDLYNLTLTTTAQASTTLPTYGTGTVSVSSTYSPTNFTASNVQVVMQVASNQTRVRVFGVLAPNVTYVQGGIGYTNYTVFAEPAFYPGESRTVTYEIKALDEYVAGASGVILDFTFTLYVNGTPIQQSPAHRITVNRQ